MHRMKAAITIVIDPEISSLPEKISFLQSIFVATILQYNDCCQRHQSKVAAIYFIHLWLNIFVHYWYIQVD